MAFAPFLSAGATSPLRYQTTVNDTNGNPAISAPVTFQVLVRQGDPAGTIVYSETVSTQTSPAGIAYFDIGTDKSQNNLASLDWGGTVYFLDISFDLGSGMQQTACSQIMSVPHAMYADSASSLILTSPSGKKFRVTVSDNGEVISTPIAE